MQYTITNSTETRSCKLEHDRNFRFRSEVACGYESETAAYAACRFIRHCPSLRNRLTYEAVWLGLRGKREHKAIRHRIKTRAALLSLPGDRATIDLVVGQGVVKVRSVHLR